MTAPGTRYAWQIVAPHFCAGLIVQDCIVVEAAPILKYMRGWMLDKVRRYCRTKGWKIL